MKIVKYKNFFIGLSLFFIAVSAVFIFRSNLNLGIEFVGGAVVEVSYEGQRPEISDLKNEFDNQGFGDVTIQNLGENNILVRSKLINEDNQSQILEILSQNQEVAPAIERFNVVGPVFGQSLLRKSLFSLLLVSLGIIIYIAYSFRKMTEPVSSWVYGLVAIITLVHDMIIPFGIYALLGLEINTLFIVGLLSILGLSVNDTIVIFDRIRENNLLLKDKGEQERKFPETVGFSLKQSMTRSINTSLTLVIVLLVLVLVGPKSTFDLVFVLLIGSVFGTYSSIFFASPLLVLIAEKTHRLPKNK